MNSRIDAVFFEFFEWNRMWGKPNLLAHKGGLYVRIHPVACITMSPAADKSSPRNAKACCYRLPEAAIAR